MANTAEKRSRWAGFTPCRPRPGSRVSSQDFRRSTGRCDSRRRIVLLCADRHLAIHFVDSANRDRFGTGWWMSPFSVELTFTGPRAPADASVQAERAAVDRGQWSRRSEHARWFPEETGEVTASGIAGIAPGRVPCRIRQPAPRRRDCARRTRRGVWGDRSSSLRRRKFRVRPRIYFEAVTPPQFQRWPTTRRCCAPTTWTAPSSTRSR